MSFRKFDMVSVDAQTALTAYVAEFEDVLVAQPDPWAMGLGSYRAGVLPIKTRWPISLSTAGYQELDGDKRLRSLADEFVEMVPKTWQDGVAELSRVVEAPDFFGWGDEPANMAKAAAALLNVIVATILAAGEATDCWDGMYFFDTGKPINKFKTGLGTYDNLATAKPVGVASLAALKTHFRGMKSANNQSLGLRLTHILSPAALEEQWRDVLERDFIVEAGSTTDATSRNRHQGSVKLIVGDELTEGDQYYGLALNGGCKPWGLQQGNVETVMLDKESALYENEKKIGVESTLDANGALLFPQCIARYATT